MSTMEPERGGGRVVGVKIDLLISNEGYEGTVRKCPCSYYAALMMNLL